MADEFVNQNVLGEVPFFQDVNFDFSNLKNRKLYVHHTLVGTEAATAANYGVFWIAPFDCVITEVQEVHQTAGSDGGAVTLDIEKLTGTQAPAAGVSALASTIDLKGTANTVVTATLTDTIANKNLVIGDRVALKDGGVLTSVDTVTVIIEIKF